MRLIVSFGLVAAALVCQVAQAQGVCGLQSRQVSAITSCNADEVYAGPLDAPEHWGVCVKATAPDCRVFSRRVTGKGCAANEVYAGANSEKLGGNCLRLERKDIPIPLKDRTVKAGSPIANASDSACSNQEIYVGPNSIATHWGTCVRE